MSGFCRTCKHWARRTRHWSEVDDHIRRETARTAAFCRERGYDIPDVDDRLAKMAELDHWGDCRMMAGPTWEERKPGTLAVAQDGSAYKAGVLTRENFSCVMFAEKEVTQ